MVVATVEIISLNVLVETTAEELDEEVKLIVEGTTIVDSVKGTVDDDVTLDNATLVVMFLVALNDKIEDGVISSLVVVVKLIVALLTTISDVCELIIEVSIAVIDEMIGGVGKGDTDDDNKLITVLVKDILGIISLKLALVKNPLPSNSVVDIPARLVTSVATLLVVNNNVEASTLESIPLPDPSSLLSSYLFSLLLLYCNGHIMSAASSFILKNV